MATGVTPAKQHLFGFKSFQIDKSQPLGLGSYGAVYNAMCDQLPCAAKVLHPTIVDLDPSNNDTAAVKIKDRFRQECVFLANIRHPNIVQYLAMTVDPESRLTVLLMELLDESLTKMLERSTQSLAYYIQVDICHDVALAIAYLHSHNIMHRDIESNNVLISAGRRAKVTDFGMAKLDLVDTAPNMKRRLTMCPGTLAYMPPGALKDPPTYTKKLDCFSQGVVMIQVCTRLFPDPGPRTQLVSSSDSTQMKEVPALETERRKKHIDMIDPKHALLPIAMDCLIYDERERPSSEELCQRLAGLKNSHHYKDNAKQHQKEIHVKDDQIKSQRQQLLEKERALQDTMKVIWEKDTMIQKMEKVTQKKDKEIASKERELQDLNQQLQDQEQSIAEFQQNDLTLQSQVEQLSSRNELLSCQPTGMLGRGGGDVHNWGEPHTNRVSREKSLYFCMYVCVCPRYVVHARPSYVLYILVLIGASLSEPHTNRVYEKIAVLLYVRMCVCPDTSSTCFSRMRVTHFRI